MSFHRRGFTSHMKKTRMLECIYKIIHVCEWQRERYWKEMENISRVESGAGFVFLVTNLFF